tara:strand:+ start:114 stop:695 length:582 start_codon:yes stop_codon:yes gene_type:complete
MSKYKVYFKKNLYMMVIFIFVILIGFFLTNHYLVVNNIPKNSLGGSFVLTDHNGNIFKSKEIKKKKLIYFGYAYCPDICPFDLLRISKIFESNIQLKGQYQPLFITVDPERDTVEKLRIFMENFDASILALTGSDKQINEVIKKFRIYVKINKKNLQDDDYLIDHSSLIFLLDENDNLLKFFRPQELNLDSIF